MTYELFTDVILTEDLPETPHLTVQNKSGCAGLQSQIHHHVLAAHY